VSIRSTTILGVRHKDKVALGGDGQVTFEDIILKHSAKKLRRLYNNTILAGFAGSAGDAVTLFERFEQKIDEFSGNLPRATVELAKDWRMDKYLRRLEALLIVMDADHVFMISGNGDVIEPDDDILAIGSGAPYALAAARALARHTEMDAPTIVRTALEIAADICVFTNHDITVEVLK
jgi:ATP-dependent HslUV protease subunit HslV